MNDISLNNILPFYSLRNNDFDNYILNHSTNNLINNNCNEQRFGLDYLDSLCFKQFESYSNDEDLLNEFFDGFDKLNDCNYYLDSGEIINDENKSLSFCCLNINSLPKNLQPFSTQCLSNLKFTFDILAFVETKLTDDIEDLYNISSYSKYTLNCNRNSGGLAIYFNNNLNVKLRQDLNRKFEFIETLFIEIEIKRKNVICGVVYRRPNSSKSQFINEIDSILTLLDKENKYVYLMGDFNINLLDSNDDSTEQFVNLMHSFNLLSLINKPTRVTQTSATAIDHIWTNAYSNVIRNGIIYDLTTDHFPIFNISKFVESNVNKRKHEVIKFRNFSEININSFKSDLSEVDWTLVESIDNPEVAYDNFSCILFNIFNKNFPLINKHKFVKPFDKPYINLELKQLIKQKNKLQRKYVKRPLTYANEYKHLRNRVTSLIRNAKSKYFKDKLNSSSGDSKKTWNVINEIIRPKTVHYQDKFSNISINDNQVIENDFITNPYDIVNKFNSYFTKIGSVLSSKIAHSNFSCTHFMGQRNPNIFSFRTVNETEISSLIQGLEDAAAGYDEMSPKIIKYGLSYILKPLTHIINCSLKTGTVPSKLKIAKVTPIFKKGSKQLFSNYRPISVLPVLSKIFEKVVHKQLTNF